MCYRFFRRNICNGRLGGGCGLRGFLADGGSLHGRLSGVVLRILSRVGRGILYVIGRRILYGVVGGILLGDNSGGIMRLVSARRFVCIVNVARSGDGISCADGRACAVGGSRRGRVGGRRIIRRRADGKRVSFGSGNIGVTALIGAGLFSHFGRFVSAARKQKRGGCQGYIRSFHIV
jgi:hypothetical protein